MFSPHCPSADEHLPFLGENNPTQYSAKSINLCNKLILKKMDESTERFIQYFLSL